MIGAELRELDPDLAPVAQEFIDALRGAGVHVTITSVLRSTAKQRKLYERFKAGLSKLPAAPPGHSSHELGLAWDMVLDPPIYEAAGRIWEAVGGRWGGRFSDPVHFDAVNVLGPSS